MRRQRFFLYGRDLQSLTECASDQNSVPIDLCLVEEDLIKQIRSVLRLGAGDRIQALDNLGNLFNLRISSVDKNAVRTEIESREENPPERKCKIEVAQSLIKGDRFEWCLEKLSELGVSRIVPVVTERCVIKLERLSGQDEKSSRLSNRLKRWQSILKESTEQCEGRTIPEILEPMPMDRYLSDSQNTTEKTLRFICVERGQRKSLRSSFEKRIFSEGHKDIESIEKILILIGPEGGFSDKEATTAEEHGWEPVSLGSRILRSETASISSVVQIASILDF